MTFHWIKPLVTVLQVSAETVWISSVAGDEINASDNVGINLECTKTGRLCQSYHTDAPSVCVFLQLQLKPNYKTGMSKRGGCILPVLGCLKFQKPCFDPMIA